MSFRQCPKKLWLEVHRPELAVEDPQKQAIFAMGNEIGEIARRLYDDGSGVLIEYDAGMRSAIARTNEALRQNSTSPVFEATVERDGLLVRADVLLRGADGPRLIEVKSSTKLKAEHLEDCAIQSWVFEASSVRPQIAAKADARRIDEIVVVDPRDIDPSRRLPADDGGRFNGIDRQPERARQIVGGAERNDADGAIAFQQRRQARIHGAIAAGDDDVCARGRELLQARAQILTRADAFDLGRAAVSSEPCEHWLEIGLPVASLLVDKHERAGRSLRRPRVFDWLFHTPRRVDLARCARVGTRSTCKRHATSSTGLAPPAPKAPARNAPRG
jgi:hypothetical protein